MAVTLLHLLSSILSCALLLGGCDAYSTFKPDCTLPPAGANYVAGPNIRSTMTRLWNCLSIILLCTWNIQHLNVPAIRPEAKSTLQIWWWVSPGSRTKVKWMLFTIFMPEFLVGKALGELMAARWARCQSLWDN